MLKTFGKFINGLLGKKDEVVAPEAPYKVPEPVVAPAPPAIVEPVVVALKEVAKQKAVKAKPTDTPVAKKSRAKAAMKAAPVAVAKPKTARKPKAAK